MTKKDIKEILRRGGDFAGVPVGDFEGVEISYLDFSNSNLTAEQFLASLDSEGVILSPNMDVSGVSLDEVSARCTGWETSVEGDIYFGITSHIVSLLAHYPELHRTFTDWHRLEFFHWSFLLAFQPQFAKICDEHLGWEYFSMWHWHFLLERQPQFEKKARAHDSGWCAILALKPHLAEKCRAWRYFHDYEWEGLLKLQPQFAARAKRYAHGRIALENEQVTLNIKDNVKYLPPFKRRTTRPSRNKVALENKQTKLNFD